MLLEYDLSNDNYLDFIEELRDKAKDENKSSHGRPILPLESDANPSYISVLLREGGINKGLLKIRRFDLRCCINYQDHLGNLLDIDEYELYDDDSKVIIHGLEGLMIGLSTFTNAVNSLLDFSENVGTSVLVKCGQKNNNVRTSLAVLCFVLFEATKLDMFSCMLNNAFKYRFEIHLSSWLLNLINDWGAFSAELLDIGNHFDTDCNDYVPHHTNAWHDRRRVIGVNCGDVAL